MKKNIQIISFILFISMNLWAKEVPVEMAETAAKNFYSSRMNHNLGEFKIRDIHRLLHQDRLMIYAFDIEQNGFVLIAGDDRVYPVIGYSFESGYSTENIPLQLAGLLEEYKKEIYHAISQNVQPDNQIENEWVTILDENYVEQVTRNVGPLIQARFNQPSPWNLLCPNDPDGPGGHALVGCVAVSMVQVMHYWSYPEVGYGSHGYNHNEYGYLFADFGEAFYDFDSMPNNVATSASQLLLYHAGIAIDMGYGPNGSGAWVGTHYPCAMSAMEEHFLYKSIIHFEEKNDYSNSNWISIMQDELDSGRPVIYRGYDNSGAGGHAWNIDGYEDDHFHCNWGWGGSYNGYFLFSNLSAGGYTFGQGQAAVMGIEPLSLSEPNIVLMDSYFEEISGDGDGVVNPGEELDIFITIQNLIPWPTATNIALTLSTEEPSITILDDYDFIEIIDTDDSYTNTSSPFTAVVSSNASLRDYEFQLNITADSDEEGSYENSFDFEVNVSLNQANFPVLVNNQLAATPTIIDLENAGNGKEILVAEYWGQVSTIDNNGNQLPGWQYDMGNQIWGTPAIGDLDGDGENEIVLTSKNGKAVILDINGNELLEYDAGQFLMGTPALGNLDMDEDLEIVFGGYTPSGKIFAINSDGSDVSGFPIILSERILGGVALADLNSNLKDDIVFATQEGNIYLIYDDATIAPGFPVETGGIFKKAPSIILPENEAPLIAVGSKNDIFYGINIDGSLRFSFSTSGDIMTSPAITSRSNGEIIIAFGSNDDHLYLIDIQGNSINGWPQNIDADVLVSPVFADLNGDGNSEIISGSGNQLFAFHLDGSLVDYFPMSFTFPFTSSLMIDDLDLDGDIEIVAGSSNDLVVVDIKSGQILENSWNMFRGNYLRNGTYYPQATLSNVMVQINEGWNLVGVPLNVSDPNYLTVFPGAIENTLFEFENDSYIHAFELVEGNGYWLRFPETGETSISGWQIPSLEIYLNEGWNLITGLSESISIMDIMDVNEIIIPNSIYFYDGGYFPADELIPGNGYWLKSFTVGTVTLDGSGRNGKSFSSDNSFGYLNSVDINGVRLYFGNLLDDHQLNQFDLPPKPPAGGLDVRFINNSRHTIEGNTIDLMNPGKFLLIEYDVKNSNWVLNCQSLNKEFQLEGKGKFSLDGNIEGLVLKKAESLGTPRTFSLHPAFPNPFNPSTTFSYDLPIGTFVTLKIIDLLGTERVVLVNQYMKAGNHKIDWQSNNIFSNKAETGVYFLVLETEYFSETQKLLLIK